LTNGVKAAEGKVGPNLRQSSRVQCVVDMFGPVDLLSPPPVGQPRSVENLIGGKIADMPELARSVSAIADVNKSAPPFFIIHGTKDATVNYQNSVNLEAALRTAGVPVLFQTVEGGGHGTFGNALPAVEDRIRLFLERIFYDRSTQVPTELLVK
jgi:acetyl esterase/lipase